MESYIRLNKYYKMALNLEKKGFTFEVTNDSAYYNRLNVYRYGERTPYHIFYKNNRVFHHNKEDFKYAYKNSYKERALKRYVYICRCIMYPNSKITHYKHYIQIKKKYLK